MREPLLDVKSAKLTLGGSGVVLRGVRSKVTIDLVLIITPLIDQCAARLPLNFAGPLGRSPSIERSGAT